jgi:DNA-binding transcriptional ArsR family regulator
LWYNRTSDNPQVKTCEGEVVKTSHVLKAIAEPRRLEILRLLRDEGDLSVTDIGRRIDVTQQAASLHLKVLEQAGLVEARRDGTRHLYSVRPEGFRPVQAFVAEFWTDHLGRLKGDIEKQ